MVTSPSLQTLWQSIANKQTPLDERVTLLTALGKELRKQQGSLEASQLMVAFQAWFRELDTIEMVEASVGMMAQLRLVSCVELLVDVTLGSCPPALATMLTDDALQIRSRAIRTLGLIGDSRAVIPLMSILNNRSDNYRLRMAAAESLGRLGDHHAVDSLMGILRSDEEASIYLRESSARALGMLGDLRAVDALLEVLNSKKGLRNKMNFLKERVIRAIGKLLHGEGAEKDVLSGLVMSLNDEAPSIRQAAVEAIGQLDDEQWISVLLPRLQDKEPLVMEATVHSIYLLGDEDALERLLLDDDLTEPVRAEIMAYLHSDDSPDGDGV